MHEEILDRNKILYNLLYVIFKRKFSLLLFWFISFILIIFFTFLRGPLFDATCKILIQSNPQQQLILFKDLATPGEEGKKIDQAQNLIQILTSQELF